MSNVLYGKQARFCSRHPAISHIQAFILCIWCQRSLEACNESRGKLEVVINDTCPGLINKSSLRAHPRNEESLNIQLEDFEEWSYEDG